MSPREQAPVLPAAEDLEPLATAVAVAYVALHAVGNAPGGTTDREMRQHAWSAIAVINKRLRRVDVLARRRAR